MKSSNTIQTSWNVQNNMRWDSSRTPKLGLHLELELWPLPRLFIDCFSASGGRNPAAQVGGIHHFTGVANRKKWFWVKWKFHLSLVNRIRERVNCGFSNVSGCLGVRVVLTWKYPEALVETTWPFAGLIPHQSWPLMRGALGTTPKTLLASMGLSIQGSQCFWQKESSKSVSQSIWGAGQ